MAQSSESTITPAGVAFPIEREVTTPVNPLPIPIIPPIIELPSQADSLPDLMSQEQAFVPKRIRTPSDSPPHVRQKWSSPHRNEINGDATTKAEVHVSKINKRDEKQKSKNKPLISRQSNDRSNK